MNYDQKINNLLSELYGPYPGVMVPTTEKEIEANTEAMTMLGKYGYRLAMVLDPSGILSIPDLVISLNELRKNPKDPINIFIAVLCLICVIPLLRYTGASIKSLILTGKSTQALAMFQSTVAVVIGGVIESAGFITEILNQLDENQKKLTLDALNYSKENIDDEEMKRISEILQKMNK